ncbi:MULTISPECIES: hypothetical protein [Sorangium]|uniref:Uncharacterized protein n=1 Tax=Sorangium cellulosum TaxID=56 RepID=A0A4P2QRK5_SORCE|nr:MULTISPECIES: hypothetical protein [Sorangium]AUX32571.1 hypothetical protein SOCE836_047140 [Sorangium cellulosum]WCQ91947.1 hypothetical protein NQZ70_04674 [Sorangium sp. Soce836]
MQAHRVAQARPASRTVSPCGRRRRRAASPAAIGLVALCSARAGAAADRVEPARRAELAELASAQPARPLPLPPAPPRRGPGPRTAPTPRTPAPAAANLSTFLELRDDYVSRGSGGFYNATVLRGDYAFDRSFALRADVPLAVASGPDGRRDAGLGDVLIRPLVRAIGTPRFALVVGSDLVLDSATRRALGSGKNQVAPLVQAYVRVARPARLGLQLQHAVSFGGDPRRDDIQTSVVRPFAIVELPRGFWVSPDQSFHFNHRGAPRVVSTSVLEVGAELSERVQVYVDPGIQVDSRGGGGWVLTGAVRWAFPQRSRGHAAAPCAGAGE